METCTETGRREFAQIIRCARGSRSHREFSEIIGTHLVKQRTLEDLEQCLVLRPNIGTIGAIATQTFYSWQELVQILQNEKVSNQFLLITLDEYLDLGQRLYKTDLLTAIQLFVLDIAHPGRNLQTFLKEFNLGLLSKESHYTTEGLRKFREIINVSKGSTRGLSDYRELAKKIGNVSHMTLQRIVAGETEPRLGTIGAIATQTPYSHRQLLAIMQGRNPEEILLTGIEYFVLGRSRFDKTEQVGGVQKLIEFLSR